MKTFRAHELDAEMLGHVMSGEWVVGEMKDDGSITFTCACLVCERTIVVTMPGSIVEGRALAEHCRSPSR